VAAVDLGPGRMIAYGTAFVHSGAVFGFQFAVFRKRIGGKVIRGRGRGPERVGQVTEILLTLTSI